MTAITVTPEIVRVVFLRRIGRSLVRSFWVRACIISALEGMRFSWCLAATWVLAWCTSSWVGDCKSIRASMISLAAVSAFNVNVPC